MDPSPTVRLFETGDAPALTDLLHRAYAELGIRAGHGSTKWPCHPPGVGRGSLATSGSRASSGRCRRAMSIGVDTAVSAEHLIRLYTGWGFERRSTIQWEGETYDSAVMVHRLDSVLRPETEPESEGDH